MFNCDVCGVSAGPRVKPVLMATDTRSTSYTNRVQIPLEEGSRKKPTFEIKVSSGSEFVREIKLCPVCAGTKPSTWVAPKIEASIAAIKGMQEYARKSNKKIEEDKRMQGIIESYKTFPLGVLSKGLEDVRVAPARWKLAYTAMENVIKRADEANPKRSYVDAVGNVIAGRASKRASRDFVTGFSLLKTYEQLGGKL